VADLRNYLCDRELVNSRATPCFSFNPENTALAPPLLSYSRMVLSRPYDKKSYLSESCTVTFTYDFPVLCTKNIQAVEKERRIL
jgi:hypothetical protein